MEVTVLTYSIAKKQLLGKSKGQGWSVFLTALVCAACFFVPYMIYDGGYFTFFGDFNVQQIPFYKLCHNAIRNGELGWSFITDLGANFIGSYTFYTITSPFFWLTLPFPNSWVAYFMGPLLILKFACSALTAYWFIRRFTRYDLSARLGGLLYAFSGFSIYNIFFNHFHEAIVFFPLLLLGFEVLVTENKRGVFALAVAACAIVNYFFFVGMMVFGIIYFVIRLMSRSIKPGAARIFAVFFEVILGILIAAVILIPSYLAIAGNSRVSEIELGWNSLLFGKESIPANVFEVFFFPPDLPARPVFFPEADVKWSSLGAWLPLLSMVGVFAYASARKGSWLKRILITCAVMAFVPILNSAFYLFNDAYYVRWFFMPILLMALATVMAMEQSDISFEKPLKVVFGITLGITLIIGFFPQTTEDGIQIGIYTDPTDPLYISRFWITCAIALVSLAIVFVLLKFFKNNRVRLIKHSLLWVCIVTIVYANIFIADGKGHSYTHEVVVDQLIEGDLELEGDPDTYRIDCYSCMDNSSMFLGYSSVDAFHSIVPSTIMDFYYYIGEDRDVSSHASTENYATRALLSVKYLIQQEKEESFVDENGVNRMPGYKFSHNASGFDVYEHENYIGYGFSYDAYMSYEECDEMSEYDRAKEMLRTILLDDVQIKKYGYMFMNRTQYIGEDNMWFTMSYNDVRVESEKRNATSAKSFKTGKNSFTATVEREDPTLVFFSIPYDEGWSATVNGKTAPIEKVNVGFMAVPVEAGTSEIVFSYKTPGLGTGAIISLSAGAVLILYVAICFVWYKKRPVTVCYPEGEELLARWENELAEEALVVIDETESEVSEDTEAAIPDESETEQSVDTEEPSEKTEQDIADGEI